MEGALLAVKHNFLNAIIVIFLLVHSSYKGFTMMDVISAISELMLTYIHYR